MNLTLLPEISLFESIARLVYPPVQIEELDVRHPSTMHHVRQIERARDPHANVESETSNAIPMKLIATSGSFIGLGTDIVPAS